MLLVLQGDKMVLFEPRTSICAQSESGFSIVRLQFPLRCVCVCVYKKPKR